MARTIVIWGAGRIGRGFVADIFNHEDWHTAFVDIDMNLVNMLNSEKAYPIYKATRDGVAKSVIQNGFSAFHTGDTASLRKLFEEENLLLDIAVHEPKLSEAADMLAPLIAHRAEAVPGRPMDVMMNVNMAAPAERFISLMTGRLTGKALDYFSSSVGVTGIFAMCISPIAPGDILSKEPLALWNNGFHEQAIGKNLLKCPPPILPRLRLTDDVDKEEIRKLYTLNMAHALSCYVGLKQNLKTAREAVMHPEIRAIISGALEESCFGLIHEYGFSEEEMIAWRETIIALMENPYIEDQLQRLGADTRRKLGAYDRLTGPARLSLAHGKTPVCLTKAIRAGFDYENDDDGTKAVRAFVKENGVEAAVRKFCDLSPDSPLMGLILRP
ncbi:MAG: hypothetical protein IJC48_06185 [Clostridia bacterium]|nr:hypothetical protein [Clostridia bacterium]